MSRWILDTDHVSLFLGKHPQVTRRIIKHGSDVAITIVTVQELFNGWIVRINSTTEVSDLVRLYGKLNRTIDFCKRVPVVGFDLKASDRAINTLLIRFLDWRKSDCKRICGLPQ